MHHVSLLGVPAALCQSLHVGLFAEGLEMTPQYLQYEQGDLWRLILFLRCSLLRAIKTSILDIRKTAFSSIATASQQW